MITIGRFFLAFGLFSAVFCCSTFAQDSTSSDFHPSLGMMPVAIYPGVAGTSRSYNIVSSGAFGATFNSGSNISAINLSFDTHLKKMNLGVGLEMSARRGFGFTNSRRTGGVVNYLVPLSSDNHELRLGIGLGLWSRSSQDNSFRYDMIDFQTGLFFRAHRFFLAYSLRHINREWVQSFPFFFTQPFSNRIALGGVVPLTTEITLRPVFDVMLAGSSMRFHLAAAAEFPGGIMGELNAGLMNYDGFGNFAMGYLLEPQEGFVVGMKAGYHPGRAVGFIGTLQRFRSVAPNDYNYFVVGMIFVAKI